MEEEKSKRGRNEEPVRYLELTSSGGANRSGGWGSTQIVLDVDLNIASSPFLDWRSPRSIRQNDDTTARKASKARGIPPNIGGAATSHRYQCCRRQAAAEEILPSARACEPFLRSPIEIVCGCCSGWRVLPIVLRWHWAHRKGNEFALIRFVYSPISPAHMDWSSHYPAFVDADPSKTTLSGARRLTKDVEVVDIGCGFGGLLVGLAPLLPETLMVGE